MKRLTLTASLLLTSLFGSGCVAIGKYNKEPYYPFKASSIDVICIGQCVTYPICGPPEGSAIHALDGMLNPLLIPFLMIDLVFSFVFDVVTFPYDLYLVGEKIGKDTDDEEQPEDVQEGKPIPSPDKGKTDQPQAPK